ncbi:MAG: hypothetical protein AAB627_01295 [Patescibacteria group bacterium]
MPDDKLIVVFTADQSVAIREVASIHIELIRKDRPPEFKEKGGEELMLTFYLARPDTSEGDESFAYQRKTLLFQAAMAKVIISAELHLAEFPLPKAV